MNPLVTSLERLVSPDGAASYILTCEGESWIVDPGAKHPPHIEALLARCAGRRIRGIFLTHAAAGESSGTLRRMIESETGCVPSLWAREPLQVYGAAPPPAVLLPGDFLLTDDFEGDIEVAAHVIHLPGVSADGMGLLTARGEMLTGRAFNTSGPTLLTAAGGDPHLLGQTLAALAAICRDGGISGIYPRTGEILDDPLTVLESLECAQSNLTERIAAVSRLRGRGVLTFARIIASLQNEGLLREGQEEPATEDLRVIIDHLPR
ncbi:hypothetical protein ACUIAJ_03615 [Dermabacteraceae bacterium CCM 9519]